MVGWAAEIEPLSEALSGCVANGLVGARGESCAGCGETWLGLMPPPLDSRPDDVALTLALPAVFSRDRGWRDESPRRGDIGGGLISAGDDAVSCSEGRRNLPPAPRLLLLWLCIRCALCCCCCCCSNSEAWLGAREIGCAKGLAKVSVVVCGPRGETSAEAGFEFRPDCDAVTECEPSDPLLFACSRLCTRLLDDGGIEKPLELPVMLALCVTETGGGCDWLGGRTVSTAGLELRSDGGCCGGSEGKPWAGGSDGRACWGGSPIMRGAVLTWTTREKLKKQKVNRVHTRRGGEWRERQCSVIVLKVLQLANRSWK